jgi:hypothetical protein
MYKKLGLPQSSREAFTLLEKADILHSSLGQKMEGIYRNYFQP